MVEIRHSGLLHGSLILEPGLMNTVLIRSIFPGTGKFQVFRLSHLHPFSSQVYKAPARGATWGLALDSRLASTVLLTLWGKGSAVGERSTLPGRV